MGKTLLKIFLFTLLGLTVLVFGISFARTIYLKSTEETKTYEIEDIYNKINIDVITDDVNIYLSENNEEKIVCLENEVVSVDAKVENGVLNIKKVDNRKFYDKFISWTNFKIDLYLSKEAIDLLNINCTTGDIIVHQGFTFIDVNINNTTGDLEISSNVTNNLDMENTTGDIMIKDCNIGNNLTIDSTTGDLEITNVNCNKLDIEITTGDTELTNVIITTDLKINGTTGDVDFDGIDANNIYIELSTGDVCGTILSSKFFNVESDTGKINVPKTRDGGECVIRVSTGDIIISYK